MLAEMQFKNSKLLHCSENSLSVETFPSPV